MSSQAAVGGIRWHTHEKLEFGNSMHDSSSQLLSRRELLQTATAGAAGLIVGGSCASSLFPALGAAVPSDEYGCVVGEPTGERIGRQILADGGNAVDAIVAAALAAGVAAPYQTGFGGYGAHAVIALEGGRRIFALDANSAAPAAMTPDFFEVDAAGKAPGGVNVRGWQAAGVPGVAAGLQLLLTKFGTRTFGRLVEPAAKLARDGITLSAAHGAILRDMAKHDPGSAKLLISAGGSAGGALLLKNPQLAALFDELAKADSVEPFYRGAPAARIAQEFQRHDGLVTADDLAAYEARLVEPTVLRWGDDTIHAAPPTAGGLSTLQALATLRALKWERLDAGPERTALRLEALRLAWRDRLKLLGDPNFANVPQAKLLSDEYAAECAAQVKAAVKAGKILTHQVLPHEQGGTINLSAADRHGNFVALTLTHGEAFGARVTIDGLGVTLGHGMSRFELDPRHPNAPGPGKRPLNNMCPLVVTRGGKTVLAAGGRGGRRIPNAMFELLTQFVVLRKTLEESMAAPRVHTEGNATLEFEKSWPAEEMQALSKYGYRVTTGRSATLSAVSAESGELRQAMR